MKKQFQKLLESRTCSLYTTSTDVAEKLYMYVSTGLVKRDEFATLIDMLVSKAHEEGVDYEIESAERRELGDNW